MIEVEQLTREYGAVRALDEVSFSVGPREIFGLLGRNGSGKTTLLRILTGFRLPSAGRIRVAGIDVVRQPVAAQRRLGYMTESPELYGELTVRGLLRFVAQARGVPRAQRDARIDELVGRFGLEAVIGRLCAHCSKGYRGRVALAAAVLHRPDVVFLDEPCAGLDPEQRARTHGLIRELAGSATLVISSHDLHEVASLCGRALLLDRGRVARCGTLDGLGGAEGLAEAFRQTHSRGAEDVT